MGLTIGLSPLKKPDLLRSVAGVAGSCERLSTVRSDRDGRDTFRGLGVASSMNGEDISGSGSGLCSRCPIREAVRKLSSDASRSLTSSCSGCAGLTIDNGLGLVCARREPGRCVTEDL